MRVGDRRLYADRHGQRDGSGERVRHHRGPPVPGPRGVRSLVQQPRALRGDPARRAAPGRPAGLGGRPTKLGTPPTAPGAPASWRPGSTRKAPGWLAGSPTRSGTTSRSSTTSASPTAACGVLDPRGTPTPPQFCTVSPPPHGRSGFSCARSSSRPRRTGTPWSGEPTSQQSIVAAHHQDPLARPDTAVLVEAAADALHAVGASLNLLATLRIPRAATSDEVRCTERLETTLRDGPSLRAAAAAEPVVADTGTVGRQWPPYLDALLEQTPFRSVVSLPLLEPGRAKPSPRSTSAAPTQNSNPHSATTRPARARHGDPPCSRTWVRHSRPPNLTSGHLSVDDVTSPRQPGRAACRVSPAPTRRRVQRTSAGPTIRRRLRAGGPRARW